MSFGCFVPGQPIQDATAFKQVAPNRWSLELESERPINEVVAFITQPLAAESALGCHVASAPFEQVYASMRYSHLCARSLVASRQSPLAIDNFLSLTGFVALPWFNHKRMPDCGLPHTACVVGTRCDTHPSAAWR